MFDDETPAAIEQRTGPTPVSTLVARELKRLADSWGANDRGWAATRERGTWVFRAYVGKPSCVVAVVGHHDLHVGLARLLGSLFEVDGT